jgi:hypothetical protein
VGAVSENRKAMALTTSLCNVGVGLVIVTDAFAGTSVVSAVLAYGNRENFRFVVPGCSVEQAGASKGGGGRSETTSGYPTK